MKTTENYSLNKIELSDAPPDITVLNANWDRIDAELKNRASKTVYTVTISTSWSGSSAPYTQTVPLAGLLATDNVHITPNYSTTNSTAIAQKKAWNLISKGVVVANGITFTCFETKPTTALSAVVEVYR